MNPLKIFSDKNAMVGLSSLNLPSKKYFKNAKLGDEFFNPFQVVKNFETDFTKNILLF